MVVIVSISYAREEKVKQTSSFSTVFYLLSVYFGLSEPKFIISGRVLYYYFFSCFVMIIT